MKIKVTEDGELILKELTAGVFIEAEDGTRIKVLTGKESVGIRTLDTDLWHINLKDGVMQFRRVR